ncbi:flagellin, partial [Pseudomonas sp. FW305-BF6]|uniref:flagellin N-terminal helical domain-containing protein n=1 Tax=Pseudomonas sp. FW305-BF6 TaxID=2070673 RepID=UPI000CBD1003
LNETHSNLQRMRELAVQGANDTNVANDRTAITNEYTELASEVNRISQQTEFNTQKLLDGSQNVTGLTFQIGANTGQSLTLKIGAMDPTTLGVDTTAVKLDTNANATAGIALLDTAITKVSAERSKLGANQN